MPTESLNTESSSRGQGNRAADLICERGILGLLLLILVLGPLAIGAVRPLEFAFIEALTIVIVLLWGVRVWLNPRYRFFWPPICWAVVAVTLYEVIRCNLSEMPAVARQEMYQVIVYAALFLTVINNVNRRESATVVAVTLVAVAVGLSCFAFYQIATKTPNIWTFTKPPMYTGRGTGTFINPNHFAGFLEMILPLALAYTMMGRFKHAAKAFLGYAALIIAAGIGVSLSRGGVIAAGVAVVLLLVTLLFQKDYMILASLMLLMIAVSVGLFMHYLPQTQIRFAHTEVVDKNNHENDRVLYWKTGLELYQKNLAWGVGSGHFNQEFWPYRPAGQGRLEFVHNDYIQTLCEWGTVGFALIGATMTLLFVGLKNTWNAVGPNSKDLGNKSSTKSAFVLGGACGLAAILVHSFLDFNMHIPANAILAVVLMALLAAHLRFATERYWVNPGTFWKSCFTLAAVIGMVYTGNHACQKATAGVYLQQAKEATSFMGQVAMLTEAAKAEPDNFEIDYKIGELYRLKSWEGKEGYQDLAREALGWFKKGMDLNPYDPFCPLRYGMCLDWLDRASESTLYFTRASALNPRDQYVANYEGWHYLQLEDYPAAKAAFQRSTKVSWSSMAYYYLDVIHNKMVEEEQKKSKSVH